MRIPKNSSRICRLLGVLAAVWLWSGDPAKAGDGGSDLGSLQNYIDAACTAFGMTSCPQIPTITQAVLQVAAFVDIAPEAVRAAPAFAIPVGPYVDAGNPSHPPGLECLGKGCVDPLNPINGLPIDPGVLSSLRPLAFLGATSSTGSATPRQLYDPAANAFVYAVGGSSQAGASIPNTLVLFYDDPIRTSGFSPGSVAGKFLLPLTVLNKDGTERQVPSTLQYLVPPAGMAPCSASTITGNFSGGGTQTMSPAKIGINCALVFGTSAISPSPAPKHAIFQISIPILITASNDPAITAGSPLGFGQPFNGGENGFTFASGKSIGIGPNPAPFPVAPPSTPVSTTPPTSATYGLCADLPTDSGGSTLLPSVSAFLAIAGDGEALVSAPLAPSIPFVCPPM